MTPSEALATPMAVAHRILDLVMGGVTPHTRGHAGEIALLKPLQGAKGLPILVQGTLEAAMTIVVHRYAPDLAQTRR